MKKKSIVARIGVVAAALTLATTSLTSGTLAKYTDEFGFTAQAMVAKWSPSVAVNGKYTWDTSLDFTALSMYDYATGAKNHIADKKMAPGMTGKIPITVSGRSNETGDYVESEVDIKYDVYVIPVDSTGVLIPANDARFPANLKFSYTPEGEGATASLIDFANTTAATGDNAGYVDNVKGWRVTTGVIEASKASVTGAALEKTVNVNWSWDYEAPSGATAASKVQYDAFDTAAGKTGGDIRFKFTVVMTQVKPGT